jgi:hypothetical protein
MRNWREPKVPAEADFVFCDACAVLRSCWVVLYTPFDPATDKHVYNLIFLRSAKM